MRDLSYFFNRQNKFSNLFFKSSDMTEDEREEMTKSLALALHAEVSELISAVNFKDHRQLKNSADPSKILYESVDVFRYLLAILNLWNIDPGSVEDAFEDKDMFLHMRHQIESQSWDGQPVLVFDIDDVIAHFRSNFIDWLESEKGIVVDKNSTEYYTTLEVKEAGFNPEEVFDEFIAKRSLRNLTVDQGIADVINYFYDEGCWIQLLTARPGDVLQCKYDTYRWLSRSGLKFHRVDFSAEKYRWLTKSEYFDSGQIVCAIDDSAKHSAEYAKHGVATLSPVTSYNKELEDVEGVMMYYGPSQLKILIDTLLLRGKFI
jgi:NTP pyrophosphatase (non-canonical NTP hydrolase)